MRGGGLVFVYFFKLLGIPRRVMQSLTGFSIESTDGRGQDFNYSTTRSTPKIHNKRQKLYTKQPSNFFSHTTIPEFPRLRVFNMQNLSHV